MAKCELVDMGIRSNATLLASVIEAWVSAPALFSLLTKTLGQSYQFQINKLAISISIIAAFTAP
jgi:hypothetical protein